MPDVILVVADDDSMMLATFRDALTADGSALVIARSTSEALDHCQRGALPEALVIDLDMRDGLAVLARLECAIEDTVPVVALSSKPRRLLGAGSADAVLMKPFEAGELRAYVQRACSTPRGAW
jgi:DNA-binding response OmpR family regulator